MEEDLEVYLDDPAMCADDPGRGSMWMRNHLSPQKMIMSETAQENNRENGTKSINSSRLRLIKPTTGRLTNPPIDQSRAQLPGKLNKQLLGEAKNNPKQLCKGADSHKQFTRAGRDWEQLNN